MLVTDPSKTDAALAAARSADGVTRVGRLERTDHAARFSVVLASDPFGQEGFASIAPLRRELRAAVGDAALVGGSTAEEADLRSAVGPIHFACSDMAGAGYQHVDGAIRMGRLVAANIVDASRS